jgi:hypothetical protein
MHRYLSTLVLVLFFIPLNAQDSIWFRYWTAGTSYTLPRHRFELGILEESRFGITDHLEISSHLLQNFLIPNLSLKKCWYSYHGFNLATKHGLFYPSPFMRTVAREGIGGFISPEFDIPDVLIISNQILLSFSPLKYTLLTAYSGIKFSIRGGELDSRTTIDLPFLYPRLAVLYSQPELDAGIDFRGYFTKRFGWMLAIDNYWLMNTSYNYFLENNVCLTYTSKKQTFRIETGSKLCYGDYLPGPQWHLLPMLSLAIKL